MKNGQKTIGVLFHEAVELMKAKYWQLVAISAALVIVVTVLSLVIGFAYLIVYLFTIPAAMILPLSAIPLSGGFDGNGNTAAAIGLIIAAVLVLAMISFVLYLVIMAVAIAVSIVELTVEVSMSEAMLLVLKGDKPSLDAIFKSFQKNWKRYLGISAWSSLWIYLWSMLFFVPGVIKSCSYLLAPYLVVQYPELTVRQALKKSMEITDGYKGRLFVIVLIMVGFTFAAQLVACCLFPVLIAAQLFWIYPLYFAMLTIAYLDIKQAAIDKGLLPAAAACCAPGSSDAERLGALSFEIEASVEASEAAVQPAPVGSTGEAAESVFTNLEEDSPEL